MANFGMGLLNAFANPCSGGSCGGGGLTLNNNNENRPVAGSTSQAITQQEMNFLQQCQATGKC
jgi:hypothetical protein